MAFSPTGGHSARRSPCRYALTYSNQYGKVTILRVLVGTKGQSLGNSTRIRIPLCRAEAPREDLRRGLPAAIIGGVYLTHRLLLRAPSESFASLRPPGQLTEGTTSRLSHPPPRGYFRFPALESEGSGRVSERAPAQAIIEG